MILSKLYDQILHESSKKLTEEMLNNLAEKEFQVDDSCSIQTAWVLSNGSCLNFGGNSRGRSLDHREISSIFMPFNFTPIYTKKNHGSSSGYMLEFMNIAKALRVGLGNDSGFVSMVHNPNRIQARKVQEFCISQYERSGEFELFVTKMNNMYEISKEKSMFDPYEVINYLIHF